MRGGTYSASRIRAARRCSCAAAIGGSPTLGRVQEVRGPGVVGEQPVLKPGESFEYTSGTPLPTPSGIMVGTYQMESQPARGSTSPCRPSRSTARISRPNASIEPKLERDWARDFPEPARPTIIRGRNRREAPAVAHKPVPENGGAARRAGRPQPRREARGGRAHADPLGRRRSRPRGPARDAGPRGALLRGVLRRLRTIDPVELLQRTFEEVDGYDEMVVLQRHPLREPLRAPHGADHRQGARRLPARTTAWSASASWRASSRSTPSGCRSRRR